MILLPFSIRITGDLLQFCPQFRLYMLNGIGTKAINTKASDPVCMPAHQVIAWCAGKAVTLKKRRDFASAAADALPAATY
jgi:hypothetical protein